MKQSNGKCGTLGRSFRCAGEGVLTGFATQRNLRIQGSIGALAVLAGLVLGLRAVEWAVLALAIGLVLVAELCNTAIEAAVDVACPDFHDLARLAKDASAGAALVAALTSVAVGVFLFLPRIIALL